MLLLFIDSELSCLGHNEIQILHKKKSFSTEFNEISLILFSTHKNHFSKDSHKQCFLFRNKYFFFQLTKLYFILIIITETKKAL